MLSISNSADRKLFVYRSRKYYVKHGWVVGNLRLCRFSRQSHSLNFTLVTVYKLNCHVNKQPVVGDLHFAGL